MSRGQATRHRFVLWRGPYPSPGDGVRYEGGRKRYAIREVIFSANHRSTVFVLWLIELGAEDRDPAIVHRCVRNVRNFRPAPGQV